MRFFLAIFENWPGRLVLIFWIVPALTIPLAQLLEYAGGCRGGYFDTDMTCASIAVDSIWPLHAASLFATIWLFIVTIPACILLIIAIIRAFKSRQVTQL